MTAVEMLKESVCFLGQGCLEGCPFTVSERKFTDFLANAYDGYRTDKWLWMEPYQQAQQCWQL